MYSSGKCTWALTHYRFFDDYLRRNAGARRAQAASSAAEIAKMSADFEPMRAMYANPLFRVPMTFIEVAPVGLAVALVSAALLRNPRLFPAHSGERPVRSDADGDNALAADGEVVGGGDRL